MRKNSFKLNIGIFFVLGFLLLFTGQTDAEVTSFRANVRVDDTGPSTTQQSNPSITVDTSGNVYVAWNDSRNGRYDIIYFAKSVDGGATFETNVRVGDIDLTIDPQDRPSQDSPSIAVDTNGNIYVVWHDYRSTHHDIYFAKSVDGGATFGTDVRVDDTGLVRSYQLGPSIAVDTIGNIYVVWQDTRNRNNDIYFTKSTDGGASFEPNVQVDDADPSDSFQLGPSMAVDTNGNIYVAWQDNRNGNYDIYFAKSTDGGATFEPNVRVDDIGASSSEQASPSIAVDPNGNVYVAWQDDRNGNHDIYFAKSTDGGTSFGTNVRVDNTGLSTSNQTVPSIAADPNGHVYVTWQDFRNNNHDIYFAQSTDGGASFGTNMLVIDDDVSSSIPDQHFPSITVDLIGNVYVVWADERNGLRNKNIYFAKSERAPETPVPISPADEASVYTLTPIFEWSAFQDGGDGDTQAGYQLRVLQDDDMAFWDFDIPTDWGILPTGWEDDSSLGSSHTYQVTTYDGRDCLYIMSTGGTWDRVKAKTTSTYKAGIYEWKVYIPSTYEEGASSSINAFLYSPQSGGLNKDREIDFEIGYGTSQERSQYQIPDGNLMCYMTIQRDDSSGTSGSSDAIAIEPGNWYILRITLSANDQNKYVASWYLKKNGESTFQKGRAGVVCGYGPDDTSFHILCSVENFESLWIGDFQPTQDTEAYFDYVAFGDVIVYNTGFISDTSGNTHFYTPGAYTGDDPVTGSTRVSNPLELEKNYYWQVRYLDSGGQWSGWSKGATDDYQNFYTSSNNPPVLVPIGNQQGIEGEWFVIPRIVATDPDGDNLTIEVENLPSGARFSQVASSPGYVEYRLSWPDRFVIPGIYNATFAASDGELIDSEIVTITITSSTGDLPPVLAPIGDKQGIEGEWFVIPKIAATDPDGDNLTIEVENLPSGARFSQVASSPGYVEYRLSWPDTSVEIGVHDVTFTASDGELTDSETITITITSASGDLSPLLIPIGNQQGQEGQWFVIPRIIATDPDGDSLTIQVDNLPSGARFSQTASSPGYVEYKLRWPDRFVIPGIYNVTFTASDGELIDSEIVTITITSSTGDLPPVLSPIGDQQGQEGEWFVIPKIIATDPDGDDLTIEVENLPTGARFSQVASSPGYVEYKLSWPDTSVEIGVYDVTFTASDGELTDSEMITITITSSTGDLPPVLSPIGDQQGQEGEWFVIPRITATDPDGDNLTIQADSLPSGARFNQVASSPGYVEYVLRWPDRFVVAGTYEVTFTASDGELTDGETITIEIIGMGEQPPVLHPIGNQQGKEGEWFVIRSIVATDRDGDTLTIEAENLPSGVRFFQIASSAGYVEYKLRWPGRFVVAGTYEVTFTASDGKGGTDQETITIEILE